MGRGLNESIKCPADHVFNRSKQHSWRASSKSKARQAIQSRITPPSSQLAGPGDQIQEPLPVSLHPPSCWRRDGGLKRGALKGKKIIGGISEDVVTIISLTSRLPWNDVAFPGCRGRCSIETDLDPELSFFY